MVRALLFDLDGTLAETDPLHLLAWNEVFKPHGVEVDEKLYQQRIVGRTTAEIVRTFLPDISPQESEAIGDAKERSFRELTPKLEPLPGLTGFLRETRRRDLSLGLVTNAPEENVQSVLQALLLEKTFDLAVLASDVGVGKPDPTPYRKAIKSLGVEPEEALAFEDSPTGISSATTAGIPTVGVASAGNPERLRESGAFLTVRDFTDPALYDLLDR